MSGYEQFANNPSTTVSSGGTTAPAQGTTETWTVSSSTGFPAASSTAARPTVFHVADPAAPSESILVTNVSGTTWTVTRGADGTTPVAHSGAFTVQQVVPAGVFGQFRDITGMINAVTEFGADPTGATDSTTAIQHALNACSPGQSVFLPRGKYVLSGTLDIPTNVGLVGDQATAMVQEEIGTDPGTVLQPTSTFTPSDATNCPAVIKILSTLERGSTSQGQTISHIMIDGSQYTAGTLHGIGVYGNVQRVWMNRVLISQMSGDGIYAVPDASSNLPDAWTLSYVFVRYCSGDGFHLVRISDSNYTKCLQTNCGGDGWYIDVATNNQFTACRSEHAGKYGYHYLNSAGSSAGSVIFTGCSTDQSTLSGYYTSGVTTGPMLQFVGCIAHRDGQNGGTAISTEGGFSINAYPAPVVMTGCTTWPGYNDNGTGINAPYQGLYLTGANKLVQISGCYFHGATQAVYDDGAGTTRWDSVTSFAYGSEISPTASYGVDSPPEGFLQPEDVGHIAWNMDPDFGFNSQSLAASGTIYLFAINIRRPRKISNILFPCVGYNTVSFTSGQNFVGLYDSSGNQVAVSASGALEAAWTSTGLITCALSSAAYLQPGMYRVAILVNGTWTTLQFARSSTLYVFSNGLVANYRWATNGTGTALPASVTLSSNGAYSAAIWVGLS